MYGTSGDDVIVTHGASVWGGDGDDLICARAANRVGERTSVNGGAGDDRVVNEGTEVGVHLGDGDDVFRGAASWLYTDRDDEDFHDAPGYDPYNDGDPGDRDVVEIQENDESYVYVEKANGRFRDDLQLGSGGAVRITAASFGNTVPVDGGSETTVLDVDVTAPRAFAVNDVADGAGSAAYGDQRLRWTGFTQLRFRGGRGVTYRGSAGAEHAELSGLASASLGGGDDRLEVLGLSGDAATLAGGTGTDVLTHLDDRPTTANTTLDLARRTLTMNNHRKALAGFESYSLYTLGSLTMLGSAGEDDMTGVSCQLVMRGGAGQDKITVRQFEDEGSFSCGTRRRTDSLAYGGDASDVIRVINFAPDSYTSSLDTELHGGAGADRIVGYNGNDTIYGEDGNDKLDGARRPRRAGRRAARRPVRELLHGRQLRELRSRSIFRPLSGARTRAPAGWSACAPSRS